jgi:hypothetical protein
VFRLARRLAQVEGDAMSRRTQLPPKEADEVRDLYRTQNTKWTVMALARSFNVSHATIRAVINRTGAYRHKPSKPGAKP